MRSRRVVGVAVFFAAASFVLASDADDGQPFGKMRERDFERLVAGAKDHGVDINAEMEKARKGDKDALARGETFFAEALASQPEAVRQRVRDFVYYAVTRVPKGHRKEVEKEVRGDFPLLFPADYVFGQDDALFG